MPRAVGLMNPDNAAKSGGGSFKEGVIRIDSNGYKVHKAKAGEGQAEAVPATKWAWAVTRMNEDGSAPLLDEHDVELKDELFFSFGGKSLPFVRPGKADTMDDEEPEDLGTLEGTEGNTIYLNAPDWTPNEKSGLMMLTKSLASHGVTAEYLNRCWAPDWNGCVFEMKNLPDKGADGKPFSYKVVTKVIVGPGSQKKGPRAVAANGKPADAEAVLAPILHKLSEELDGQALTRKAFLNRVRGSLEATKADTKLLVPVLALCKDDKWLGDHAQTFDYTLYPEDQTIMFGMVK